MTPKCLACVTGYGVLLARLARRGLGCEDRDVECPFRHVELEVTGSHLTGGFLIGNWICRSIAQN